MVNRRRSKLFTALLGSSLLASTQSLAAIEILATYDYLGKVLERETFKDKGRYYLDGNSESRCKYAYLENPALSAEGGLVYLRVHFSGRLATEILGNCVGPGDAFHVLFSGRPYAEGGVLGLRNLRIVRIEGANRFRDVVRNFLADRLPQIMSFDLGNELRRNLKEANRSSPYLIEIRNLEIQSPRAEAQHLVMNVDFHLDVSSK